MTEMTTFATVRPAEGRCVGDGVARNTARHAGISDKPGDDVMARTGPSALAGIPISPAADVGTAGAPTDVRELIREVSKEARKSPVPIFIAMLAAFLAFMSMAEGDANSRALGAHVESANQFAFFQAKNIRLTSAEAAADVLRALDKPSAARTWQAKADRYEAEKSDILVKARGEQSKRATAMQQADYFAVAIATLQIAIVLASASLILGGGVLLFASVAMTAVATFFAVNGYGLYIEIPTDPAALAPWVQHQLSVVKGVLP